MNGRTSILTRPGGKTRSDSYATPIQLYRALDVEFAFDFDPCPLQTDGLEGTPIGGGDGLAIEWTGRRVFCNPPYRHIALWLRKAREADVAVYLVPSRTDTDWWHRYALAADEVRFLRGRLKFGGAKTSAPFASVVLVYRRAEG